MLVRRNTITYPAWKPGRKTLDKIRGAKGRKVECIEEKERERERKGERTKEEQGLQSSRNGVADQSGGVDERARSKASRTERLRMRESRGENAGREAGGLIGRKLSARAILRRIRDSGFARIVSIRPLSDSSGVHRLPPTTDQGFSFAANAFHAGLNANQTRPVYSPTILHADTPANEFA